MQFSTLNRYVGGCAAAVMLAACAAPQSAFDAATAMPAADHVSAPRGLVANYAVLFSFDRSDGAGPQELLDVNGTFYGVTYSGGNENHHCVLDSKGCGTVVSITPSGTEKVLYKFVGAPDGSNPNGQLTDVNGVLYGTTVGGGKDTFGCGTVFSVTTAGKERVLYRFADGSDGCRPSGGLLNVDGTLYGTTSAGGVAECNSAGCGTVYTITTAGKHRVLYDFGGVPDGSEPAAALLDVNGTLYGTTFQGGTGVGGSGSAGDGTVYSITTAGKERVLYSFAGSRDNDGAYPSSSLLDINGTLYGTTSAGGIPGASQSYIAYGTVFGVTTAGQEHILHTFESGADGATPRAGLTNVNGELYGTTQHGGGVGSCYGYSCGTVFSITTAGNERIRHRFAGKPDGQGPGQSLLEVKGTLYGTTGGGGDDGFGTVFTLKP